jgi:hypothetical protein
MTILIVMNDVKLLSHHLCVKADAGVVQPSLADNESSHANVDGTNK